MTSVLVTGGAGYVGSHSCKALAAAGLVPVTYDNLGRGHREAVKWGTLETGDIRDRERLDAVLRQHRPEAILHCAAIAYVGESVADPAIYYDNNVTGSQVVLEAARGAGIDCVVFSSSCTVYGLPAAMPVTEDMPCAPISPYGRTKMIVEGMLRDYGAAYGMRSIILRYFNASGADPDGETGEDHDPEPHLIPRALMAAAGDLPHLDILGADYPTPDGTAIRDYIHVSDLADAHVRALRDLLAGGASDTLNLGTGVGYSVSEIVAAVERITAKAVPVRTGPRRPGDPAALWAAPGRAQARLQCRLSHSDLDTIIATAWKWHCRPR
ncbi:UDP-glucose 4-epimerase [Bradyrhizobium sp. LTSPM299]|uniref:UDP-glucose 4-epimerase GalE n=1 Tax=Bradyrhizobium sp. LTSPM299 TaxID=1619233 RepID=UPI0005C9DEEC|nr:UDP-glucose 4-epimerase GalE [Bradyrhizobium sp. LTSPM299]KJC59519.1 UDP-glucose 4-epimerase [Bradyrhizobium sp. LTSPM299]